MKTKKVLSRDSRSQIGHSSYLNTKRTHNVNGYATFLNHEIYCGRTHKAQISLCVQRIPILGLELDFPGIGLNKLWKP